MKPTPKRSKPVVLNLRAKVVLFLDGLSPAILEAVSLAPASLAKRSTRRAGASPRARTGKIARLPFAIRAKLNQQIRDGKAAAEILTWLNGLTSVRTILTRQFSGAKISDRNLSLWRAGGYREWLQAQDGNGR